MILLQRVARVESKTKTGIFVSSFKDIFNEALGSSSPCPNLYSFSSVSGISDNGNRIVPMFSPWMSTGVGTSSTAAAGEDWMVTQEVALSFKEWFKSGSNALYDQIFQILQMARDDQEMPYGHSTADLALSSLGLRLNELFVLDVLRYGSKDVLSCLKFFDWAGHQPGFFHTRATFVAIFKILSKAKLMSLMFDFLENYVQQKFVHKARFYNTLVMGYAVAGKPIFALQLFGKMRFQGLDLDSFAYHVLLNSLVEENCFDAVHVIVKQITLRGFVNEITHYLMLKNFCKQSQLDEAETFLHDLVGSGKGLNGRMLGFLVSALCKSGNFERAWKLVEGFRDLELVSMDHVYGVWITELIRAGMLERALQFLYSRKSDESYIPDVFRYNMLIHRLLRDNRLQEVFDLLTEMMEEHISPDKVTMNAAMCFLCKAGMVDVALDLYNSRSEYRLSPNSMAYNYLVNTLCGDGSTDEAYHILKHSIDQGYFPGKKTFSILADALCREGKLDKMKELVIFSLERNFMPSGSTYDKFISALCKARRVEDGYLIHGELNRINVVAIKSTYFVLIDGFNKLRRGDISARLLIEMQEKGHNPTRKIFRTVIHCLNEMENMEKQFFNLLELQLSRQEPSPEVYNNFIYGAALAKKSELAREVYQMMLRSGIQPNLSSDILLLKSYLHSERISDALNFLSDLYQTRTIGRKISNVMVVGLCKANKADVALDVLRDMRDRGLIPSIECYEELAKHLCHNERYDLVVNLINDLDKVGRPITSFLGNTLLYSSMKTQKLYEAWVSSREGQVETSRSSMLGLLIGAFSGHIRVSQSIKNLEEAIAKCFPLDIYTYNLLLRRLSANDLQQAFELFNRLCEKGYVPNRWTYDILVHALFKHGRTSEAKRLLEVMYRKGFAPTECTKAFI
ncbi:pentatricopeptide repeat-containing protein At1g71210, mitochondrial [Cucurbita moschata]|uniref:Pentatricopeptide repeat-containing protein At1g71210, mitochondrial n=1 Tax=Cucurbita moschata TaxID=3662 RepID=A0A6J1G442_CUCMO|nr:pentatricopeptide repeat-containing protein At1g71210, mitochondrial [Cucurbita moschata]XP_022946523.1 pentatricopeptide repeat-containing protein At1g71210, mitochondrial [Cucurbita moschata]